MKPTIKEWRFYNKGIVFHGHPPFRKYFYITYDINGKDWYFTGAMDKEQPKNSELVRHLKPIIRMRLAHYLENK